MAYAYLLAASGEEADALAQEIMPGFPLEEMNVVRRLIERGLNCPITSSMGRLFDAASALLGVCTFNSFHAQAPMELEASASNAADDTGCYAAGIETGPSGIFIVRTADVIRALVADRLAGVPVETAAARFHRSIARLTLDMCVRIRDNTGMSTVALSGGVFGNAFLVESLLPLLEGAGFEVLLNSKAPAGDGGISLGQAAIAAWRMQCA